MMKCSHCQDIFQKNEVKFTLCDQCYGKLIEMKVKIVKIIDEYSNGIELDAFVGIVAKLKKIIING